MTSADRFERLREGASQVLPRLLSGTHDRITVLLLDAPGGPGATDAASPQRRCVSAYEGVVMATHGTAIMARLSNPALAIGSWLVLGDEVEGALGGAAEGFGHSHDLLHASMDEATALASLAEPSRLMLPFDVTGIVDLRDARFSVESPDRGALVPWSCRLVRRGGAGVTVRDLTPADADACDAIIAGLPDWFGLEQGIHDCAAAVRSERGLVAEAGGEVVGFLSFTRDADEAEITWMAVSAGRRRGGFGRALTAALSDVLRSEGVREIRVKTLSSRHPDPGYAQTRAFYASMGFVETRELDIWGPDNPAVLLTRPA